MDILLSMLLLFPLPLRVEVQSAIDHCKVIPEEFRIKLGRPVTIRSFDTELFCKTDVTKKDLMYIIGSATECSYHAAVRHLKNGYIPLYGGGRMGLCGVGRGQDGVLCSLDEITSVCIRIPSEKIGCSDDFFTELVDGEYKNTIVIAPPGAGKTTLLRELIRKLSYGGLYIGVVDERGEISGQNEGRAAFDIGPRCDVLTGVPRASAAMMLLRAMSPNVIAMDEITAHSDMGVIMEAVGCGVGLLTTMHGEGLKSLEKPMFSQLKKLNIFEKAILIRINQGKRLYEVIDLYA